MGEYTPSSHRGEERFARWFSTILLKFITLYCINGVERILRLDSDALVLGDVSPLLFSDLSQDKVALETRGCFDSQKSRNARPGLRDDLTTNAGVCFINDLFLAEPIADAFIKMSPRIFPAAEQNSFNCYFDGEKVAWKDDKYMRIALQYLVANK